MVIRSFFLVLLASILMACAAPATVAPTQTGQLAPTETGSTRATPAEAYPVPTVTLQNTSYPLPEPGPTNTTSPTIDAQQLISSSTGAIEGVLLDLDGNPISGIGVFLAMITPGPTPETPIISFTLNSPSSGTNRQGRFVIGNIPPGTYSLAVWTPATTTLIPTPGGEAGSAIKVEVVNNQVTNIGEARIRRP